ncbi:MAG: hypothetical protein ABSH12_02085 [Endomicrobiales bacterium]|jgi:tetratricopeptide (TPR) repeat protein
MRKSVLMFFVVALVPAMLSFSAYSEQVNQRDPMLQQAMNLAKEKKFTAAIDTVTQGISSGQMADTYEAHLFLGAVYYKTKDYDDAIQQFTKTTAMQKNSRMSYWFLGHIYEAKALKVRSREEKRGLQENALEAWKNLLLYPRTINSTPTSQKRINVSVEESNEQAKKHIKTLQRELQHE